VKHQFHIAKPLMRCTHKYSENRTVVSIGVLSAISAMSPLKVMN